MLSQNQPFGKKLLNRNAFSRKAVVLFANSNVRFRSQKEAIISSFVKNSFKNHKIKFARIKLRKKARRVVNEKLEFVPFTLKKTANFRKKNVISD